MTARVPLVSQDRANQLGQEWGMAGPRMTRSAIRVLANNPALAKPVLTLLSQLLEHNQLDARLRELMIMRIGWVTGSAYEWTQHWRVATVTCGIPPEDVLAVRDWKNSDRLTAADKAVLAATDETLAGGSISDATWANVVKAIPDPAHQVEFIVAMGNWTMFSMLLRNLRVPVEDGVMVWPPDGMASPAASLGTAVGKKG